MKQPDKKPSLEDTHDVAGAFFLAAILFIGLLAYFDVLSR